MEAFNKCILGASVLNNMETFEVAETSPTEQINKLLCCSIAFRIIILKEHMSSS